VQNIKLQNRIKNQIMVKCIKKYPGIAIDIFWETIESNFRVGLILAEEG